MTGRIELLTVILLSSAIASAQNPTRIGLGFGGGYDGEDFITHVDDLGIDHYHINIKWGWFEPDSGQYQDAVLDAFLDQLPPNSEALIRISTRGNTLFNDPATDHTVPMDLTIGGPYYDLVHHIVSRDTENKVAYYENEWEFNFTKHWGGESNTDPDPVALGHSYADLTRVTEAAINAANPNAKFIMGGTTRATTQYTDSLLRTTLADLTSTDSVNGHCDYYDQHLYKDLYSIPSALGWFRDIMDDYPAFADKPVFSTESGGPIPSEFALDTALNAQLVSDLSSDYCLLAGDMTGLGYPGHYRMFAFGVEPELDAKRDSIQANNYIQRTLLGLAHGVERMYTWAFETKWTHHTSTGSCYVKDMTFGKLALSTTDHDNNFVVTNANFDYYKEFVELFKNTETVTQDTTLLSQDIYFFEIETFEQDTFYVVWEKRDQYYGVYDPVVNFSFNTPWGCVGIKDLFEREESFTVSGGMVDIEINDVPLILTDCDNIVSIGDLHETDSRPVAIYPNPTSNLINIRSETDDNVQFNLEIFDMNGRIVRTRTFNSAEGENTVKVDMNELPKGVYQLRISDRNRLPVVSERILRH